MFQSSPTPKGGRYLGIHKTERGQEGFNPRPPRKVGATARHSQTAWSTDVSILAHPERWALHVIAPTSTNLIRVSILAHPERWALRPIPHRRGRGVRVSILAHPERWALRDRRHSWRWGWLVSILAHPERWALHGRLCHSNRSLSCFNPRPPRKVGATWRCDDQVGQGQCFNPRPPRKVGATVVTDVPDDADKVSILAHPERWALQSCGCTSGIMFTFQSSPTPKGGRYDVQQDPEWHPEGFNPRPPRKVGATQQDSPLFYQEEGFNPRPPRKVGATLPPGEVVGIIAVSILAHPERWALRDHAMTLATLIHVSILAHPERWALRWRVRVPLRPPCVSILAHPERWALRRTFETC